MTIDRQKMMSELQRQDSDIPLQGSCFAKIRSDYRSVRDSMELPEQFLRACTLREGTWVVVLFLNSTCLLLIAFLAMLIIAYPEETEDWWKERFRDDFDFYYQDESQDLINALYPLWLPLSYAIIGVKTVYFVTGVIVFYALVKKTVHPCWYMPWMIMTAMLCLVMWLMCGTMIIVLFILLTYRPITVTWDIGPIVCVIVYSVAWSYALFVVIAHYRRRCIVKYWRDKQSQMGTDNLGPQGY